MIMKPRQQPASGNTLQLLMEAAAAAEVQRQQQAVQMQLQQQQQSQQKLQQQQLNNNNSHHHQKQHKNRKTSPTSATRQEIASESNLIHKIAKQQTNHNNNNIVKKNTNNKINNQLNHDSQSSDQDHVELRKLETWYDEDGKLIDDDYCQELADIVTEDGWSADDMFKYNEKMHKVSSTYNEKTLGEKYTTPLPKSSSKTAIRMATQLAKEIEKRISDEGRITPESSDDDELFEAKRKQKKLQKLKLQHSQIDQAHNQLQLLQQQQQQKHLKEKKNEQRQANQTRLSDNQVNLINNLICQKNTTKLLSHQLSLNNTQCSMNGNHNFEQSPSTSPTLKHTIIRPVSSSSRNILRSCLA